MDIFRSWKISIFLLILLIFILWILIGRNKSKPFIGLQPLEPGFDPNNYSTSVRRNLELGDRSNFTIKTENQKLKTSKVQEGIRRRSSTGRKSSRREIRLSVRRSARESIRSRQNSKRDYSFITPQSTRPINSNITDINRHNFEFPIVVMSPKKDCEDDKTEEDKIEENDTDDKIKMPELPSKYVFDMTKKRANESRGEAICRQTLEQIYKSPFISTRPDFLKNPRTGKNLELDGFNEDLRIAFEYNGEQHYKYPNDFHKTKDDFEDQIMRDQYKLKKCEEYEVYLITVPYDIPHKHIPKFIEYYLPEAVALRNKN